MLGKQVGEDLYLHCSALPLHPDERVRQWGKATLAKLSVDGSCPPNVLKVNLRHRRVSWLTYPEFDTAPFPPLSASWVFASPDAHTATLRSYADSLNPPILHRKELLVAQEYPGRAAWAQLTEIAESLGLFDAPSTIGFQLNWQRAVAAKGYQLLGHEFLPLGNALDGVSGIPEDGLGGRVQRHLTALSRNSLSAPVQLLLRHGLLTPEKSFFDYGCGRGDDLRALNAEGFSAQGWDPHFAGEAALTPAQTVNLGFVLNVIEDPAERITALSGAFSITQGVLAVSVMLTGVGQGGRPYGDGVLTSRGTFQKYFAQSEFKDYLEQALHCEVFLVGPGIAFAFANKELEQQFLAQRFRRRDVATRLLALAHRRVPAERMPSIRPTRVDRGRIAEERKHWLRAVLLPVWERTLDLGRWPEPDELADLGDVIMEVGGLRRAMRLLRVHFDAGLLHAASQQRADDVRLYLAVQQFGQRPAYKRLELRLQRDIKAFFGDYGSAQAAGMRLLINAAEPSLLLQACQFAAEQGLGHLEAAHSLQLHVSLVERLPAVLRAYVACGLLLWSGLSDVQHVKIHVGSGKLTLLEYEDYERSALPRLKRRIKVNLRRQDYDVFEYGSTQYPMPVLYRKARYLHVDMEGYADQLAFDEALEALGVIGADGQEGDPSYDYLVQALEVRRMGIDGCRLTRATTLPDLDHRCGATLTYRALIACGETQQRLGLGNLPLNPASYNALHDLATHILDPVIEYFGPIRLTYGFCSPELGKHINKRVSPKLDQHAAHECNRNGRPICERGGAACDFLVDDEDMLGVAEWIWDHLPIDRLYFYGPKAPIHVSYGPQASRQAYEIRVGPKGGLIPAPLFKRRS